MIALRGVVVAVLVGSVVGGCGPKKNSTMDPTVAQAEDMPRPQTAENRAERLGQAIDEFAAARKGLQGHSDEQSRAALAGAMGKMSDVLALLQRSEQDGRFRQQLRIIERARAQLTGDSATSPEPTVNAAIRAAQNALSDLAREQYGDEAQVQSALESLRPIVDGLANVRGPIHGFDTARALDAIGAVTERMAEVVQQRLAPAGATTAPATNPE